MHYTCCKTPQFGFMPPPEPRMQTWCVIQMTDDKTKPIEYLQDQDCRGLSEAGAKKKAEELNSKLMNSPTPEQ